MPEAHRQVFIPGALQRARDLVLQPVALLKHEQESWNMTSLQPPKPGKGEESVLFRWSQLSGAYVKHAGPGASKICYVLARRHRNRRLWRFHLKPPIWPHHRWEMAKNHSHWTGKDRNRWIRSFLRWGGASASQQLLKVRQHPRVGVFVGSAVLSGISLVIFAFVDKSFP